jgi:hypothetical protein
MELLCGFSEMIILVGIIGDRVGQLGESGEYWMGRLRVAWIINSELQGCSPPVSIKARVDWFQMNKHLKCRVAYKIMKLVTELLKKEKKYV